MTPREKACALAAHVAADLASQSVALGAEMPEAKEVLAALSVTGHERDDFREAVYGLYRGIRAQLTGSSPAAALGFGLGRMLADTVLLPSSCEPQVLGDQFGKYRLAHAFDWLDDLDTRLPAHSAAAVRASLREWEQWVAARRRPDGKIDPAKVDKHVTRTLRKQGELWRQLLTGERMADQLLDGRAYVGAAASLLANSRRIAFHYITDGRAAAAGTVFHQAGFPDVLRPGRRADRAGPPPHDRRDAAGSVPALAARPGALLLLPRPLGTRRTRGGRRVPRRDLVPRT